MGSKTESLLRRIREKRNLTQKDLAQKAGVARSIISEFESKKRRPSPRTISKLAKTLDYDYVALISDYEDNEIEEKEDLLDIKQKYLQRALKFVQHSNLTEFSADDLTKITGYLAYLLENYDLTEHADKKDVITEAEEQRLKLKAYEIFLQHKNWFKNV